MKQEITFFQKGMYRIHVTDSVLQQKLEQYKDLRPINKYFDKKGVCGWDFVFPSNLHNRVAKLAKLPLKMKNKNRVQAGKQSKVGTGEKRYDLTKVKSHQTPYTASKTEEVSKDTLNT